MRNLIAEDSTLLRNSLSQGLREAGFAVDAVADGRRALAESADGNLKCKLDADSTLRVTPHVLPAWTFTDHDPA